MLASDDFTDADLTFGVRWVMVSRAGMKLPRYRLYFRLGHCADLSASGVEEEAL